MQGRLLPPFQGRFQAFPATSWREEFTLAREAGLYCIEWIYEEANESINPLATDVGLAELLKISADSQVAVCSLCADYYMSRRLIKRGGILEDIVFDHLVWLISRAKLGSISYIVLPFVDASSLQGLAERDGLVRLCRKVAPMAADAGIELHLETDLSPALLAEIVRAVNSPWIKVNYDVGNSASLGHKPQSILSSMLGSWIGSVHIKDRILGGGTVALGAGQADFSATFSLLKEIAFERWVILQANRDPTISEVELARKNRKFVEAGMGA